MSSLPLSPKSISFPVERALATATISSAGKLPLDEDVEELAPDIAGGAHDRDPIAHILLLERRGLHLGAKRAKSMSARWGKHARRWHATGLILGLLVAAFALKGLLLVPPAPSRPAEFDVDRAMGRLDRILGDQRPHPGRQRRQ